MPKPLLIAVGAAAWRRTVWMQLTEREVTAEDGHAGIAECGSQRNQEWGLAVCSGTVSEDEAIAGGDGRNMQKTVNSRVSKVLKKRRYSRLNHRD
jgi:hypothetical protein